MPSPFETKHGPVSGLETTKEQKQWTETSPNSKLSSIKETLSHDFPQHLKFKVTFLNKLLQNSEYKKFQKTIGCPLSQCDGKLGKDTEARLNCFLGTHISLANLAQDISNNHQEAQQIQQVEDQYLENHQSLTQKRFEALFSGKEAIQQGQLGDCYLVSTLNILSKTQFFDTLMKTSIQEVKWKSGEKGWKIFIPFGEPLQREAVYIKESELSVAKIRGNIGYKLLELAYAKHKLQISGKITPTDLQEIAGGKSHEALATLIGQHNVDFKYLYNSSELQTKTKSLDHLQSGEQQQILSFLKNYDFSIGNRFITLGSRRQKGGSDQYSYKIGTHTLYFNHAYSIDGIIRNSKGEITGIKVLNPWNVQKTGGNHEILTPDELLQGFSSIGMGTLKVKTFLDEKSVSFNHNQ